MTNCSKGKLFDRQWDKADKVAGSLLLFNKSVAACMATKCLATGRFSHGNSLMFVSRYCTTLVSALCEVSNQPEPEVPCWSSRPFRSSELVELEQDSTYWPGHLVAK